VEEKAHTVAKEKFSIDEVDSATYQNIVLRRKNSIPTSNELLINLSNRKVAEKQLSDYLDSKQMKSLFNGETVNFEKGQEVGTSFIYYDTREICCSCV